MRRREEPTLQLDRRFTHLVESDGSFVLVGDEDSVVLEGKAVAELLKVLDGTCTAIDVANALSGKYRPELVHFALLRLLNEGIVREGETHLGSLELSAEAVILQQAWDERGTLGVVRSETPHGVTLFMTDDYLYASLPEIVQKWQQERDAAGLSSEFTLVRLGRRNVWVGPTLGTDSAPCTRCLQERLTLNLTGRALMRAGSSEHSQSLRIELLHSGVDPTVFEVAAAARPEPETPTLRVFDLETGETNGRHRVEKLPHCSNCGDPSLSPPGAAFTLEARTLTAGSSSGFRICDPEETLARYSPLVSQLTGVVRDIRKVEVGDTELVHVYTASHAGHYSSANVKAIKDDARDHSGGKGMTDLDARVSALCESLERFSAVHRGTEPAQLSRRSDLGSEAFLPNDLMLFSESQFRNRVEWNDRISGGFQWVPEVYADQVIAWSPVRSLGPGGVRLVPSSYLYLGFQGVGGRFCKGDSNGLAGGNCLEEAILQGFLELVERDAIALWWYSRGDVPGINLAGVGLDYVEKVLAYYTTLGRRVWALDLTTDLGIPCVGAFSSVQGGNREDIIFGFGCHVTPAIALRRAITELNQMLPTVLKSPQERERQLLPDFADAINWWNEAVVADHPYLEPGATGTELTFEEDALSEMGLTETLVACVDKAEAVGLETFAHDLTRPDVGFSVAKVIVPGLRHFWRRTGRGRLYEVPVRLGWTQSPLAEDELNPISLFV